MPARLNIFRRLRNTLRWSFRLFHVAGADEPRARRARKPWAVELLEERALCSNTPDPLDVALVDRTLPNADVLIKAALGQTRVVTFDGRHDSPNDILERVVHLADEGRTLGTLSVFSHGAAGKFALGTKLITGDELAANDDLAEAWGRLGDALTPGGDIYLFGCSVADGVSGRSLLGKLSDLTHANVFGSTNISGAGGDWDLELASFGPTPPASTAPRQAPFNYDKLITYAGDLALPVNWSGVDLGTPGAAGSSSESTGTFTIAGAGSDISGTSDNFRFTYTTMTGDGDIIARVATQQNTNALARAGVMIRNALTANSRNAFALVTPSNGRMFQYRTSDGGTTTTSATTQAGAAPVWVRISRVGDTMTGYVSSNGSTWTSLGSISITMGSTVYVGLAVTSHVNATLNTSTFDNVTKLEAPTNLTASPASTSRVEVTWDDNSALESGYLIERSTDGSTWSQIGSVGTGGVSYSDTGLSSGTKYYYRVRAYNGSNYTDYSSVVGTTTLSGSGLSAGEMFAYSDGSSLSGLNTGTGFSAGWTINSGSATINGPGLTYSDLQVGGLSLSVPSTGGSASRTLTSSIGTSGTTRWASFLIRRDTATTTSTYGGLAFNNLFVGNDNTTAGAGTNTWRLESTSQTGPVDSGMSLTTGSTYLLVVKMVFAVGNDQFTLYVNPTPGSTAPTGGVTKSDLDMSSTSTLTLAWAGSGFSIDEFRLGTSYADVAPATKPLVSTTSTALTYGKNGGTLAVDDNITVNHPTGANLTGATVQITGNYQSGQDLLSFTNQNGITGSWSSATGTLTLTGTTTAANYETALRSILYSNSSSSPSTLTRTVSFTVTDSYGASSATDTRGIGVFDLDNGLAAHWALDEGSGTTAHDAVGGNHGSLVNTPAWVTGELSGGLTATGTSYVSVPPGTLGKNVGAITLAGWVKLNSVNGAGQQVISIETNGTLNTTRAALRISSGGALEVYARDVDGGGANIATSSGTITSGVWTHLAAVIDYAANTITLYINGVAASLASSVLSNFTAATTTPNTTAGGVTLGAHADGSQVLNGSMDDLRIYHRALSSTEIAAIADVPNEGPVAPVAVADGQGVNEDNTLTVNAASGVLANDTDAEGDRLTAILETNVSHGTLTLNADGSFTYLPATNYFGSDSFTYRAYDGTFLSPPATVTLTVAAVNDAPTVATAAAATPSTVTGTTTALSTLGADVDDGEPALTYTWSVTAKPTGAADPTYSANGTNAAKNATATFTKAGSYTFQVTTSDGSLTTTSSVSVTVNQTLTTITVSPSSASLNLNQTQSFSATAYDQFGAAMSSQPSFTWSIVTGVGSVDAAGLYSSGSAAGSATVKAASGAVNGTASVTVTNAAPSVATAAAATPSTVTGSTSALSVLGADDGGEPNLTYTWAATSKPAGSNPIFSANGTNAAKASTVTFDKAGSYTFQVTISDGSLTTTSSVAVTVNQTLTSITVSPSSASLNLNQSQSFSATAYDQFGIAMSSQPSFTWSKVSGVGSIDAAGLYSSDSAAGAATVKAASGAVNGTASITVTNATPTVATAAGATPGTVTGTTTGLSALGADDGGESNLTYTWAATSKPAGATPTFSVNGTNAAKASTVTFDKAGSYTFQVTIRDAGGLTTTSSIAVTVNQTLTTIQVAPASVTLSISDTQQFTATGYDQFGATMVSQPSLTWSVSAGTGSVDASGLYTAPAASGSATVQASSGGVNGTASVTIVSGVSVSATPNPVTGTTTSLSVIGAGAPGLTFTWSVTSKPAGATDPNFSDNGTNSAKNTTATFDKAGSYTFDVEISDGVTSTIESIGVTVNQTLTTITVSPAAPTINLNQTQSFTAAGFDQFGNAMAVAPTFTWSVTAGSGSVDAAGLYTASGSTGSATVRAANGAIQGTASVTITDAAPTVATPAAAVPTTVTGTTSALSVLGADDGGESNLTYTWTATASPAGSSPSFSANGTNAAKASTVTFDKAGSYTFQVIISDGTASVTSSVAVTVNQTLTTVTVSPATASLTLNDSQAFSATAYDQFGDAMAVQPAFTWSKLSGVGSVDAAGLYTSAATPGSATVQAAAGAVNGTATVTVTNAAPTVATPAAAVPSPATGTTTALSVLGADDGGEAGLTYTWAVTVKPAGSSPGFSANGTNAAKASTVTFDKAGNYTFQVTISDGISSTTSSVSLTVNQTLTSITVSPASASLNWNQTRQFTATGYDQFGNALASQPAFTWTVGSGSGGVDAAGLYTAPAADGSATVVATSGAVNGSASVTVTNASPTVATAANASPSPVTGTTATLSALGADDGGEANLTYTWATTGTPPAAVLFSANGTNGAKSTTATFAKSGSYTFQVTITDGGGLSVTSATTVIVNQTMTTITLTPGSATLPLNGTRQFTAAAYDQFGDAMQSTPTFTWSVTAGGGSVSSTGFYSAPATPGSYTVHATSGLVDGTAALTVADTAPTVATPATATPSTVTTTTTALSVAANDDAGEPGLTYTWSATSAPAGATPLFSANGTNASKSTTVTFDKLGAYTFQVTIDDGTNSVTSSVNVTVDQGVTSIVVSPASTSLNLGQSQQLTATAYDQFGDPMSVPPTFTWSKLSGVGSVDSTGLYQAPASGGGSGVLEAAVGSVNATASVTVTDAAPTVATAADATPTTVTGTTTDLSVLGADDGGESNLTYTWSATSKPAGSAPLFSANGSNAAKAATVTFDKAGSYTFQVTISDGTNSVTSSIAVTVDQTLTTIAVSPSTPSLTLNGSQAFAALAYDQFGDLVAVQPAFTWSILSGVGSVDAAGLYQAPSTIGAAVVQATAGSVNGTATITVTDAGPTVAAAASAAPGTVTATTTVLSVLGTDDGGESNLTYTWSVAAKPSGATTPTFDINGSNAAKAVLATFTRAGTYQFVATISDGTSTTTSAVTVVVNQTLTRVTVSPASATVSAGTSRAFAATALDQFDNALATQPTFAWSIDPGGIGTISTTGVYSTDPEDAGTAVVRARIPGYSATAAVTVADTRPEAPTGLSGQAIPGGEVLLIWNYPASAQTGFRIERSLDGSRWRSVGETRPGARNFVDTGLIAGTTYSYRVIAIRNGQASDPGNVIQVVGVATLPIDDGGSDDNGDGGGSTGGGGQDSSDHGILDGGGGGDTNPTDNGDSGSNDSNNSNNNNNSNTSGGGDQGNGGGGSTNTTDNKSDGQNGGNTPTPNKGSGSNDGNANGNSNPSPANSDNNSTPSSTGGSGGSGGQAAPATSNPPAANLSSLPATGRMVAPATVAQAQAAVAAYRDLESREQVQQEAAASAEQAAQQKKQQQVVAGAAAAVGITAVAGYMMWLVQGGSLLMSLVSTMPFWRWFDPLPVLDSWDKPEEGTKGKKDKDKDKEKDDKDEEEQLRGLLD